MIDYTRLKLFAASNNLDKAQIEEITNIIQDIEMQVITECADKISFYNSLKVDGI